MEELIQRSGLIPLELVYKGDFSFLSTPVCENLEGPSWSVRDGHLVRYQKLKTDVT